MSSDATTTTSSSSASASAVLFSPSVPRPYEQTNFHQQRRQLIQKLCSEYPTLHVPHLTPYTLSLHTKLRDDRTDTPAFVTVADQLLRQLVEFALSALPTQTKTIQTPTGTEFIGCEFTRDICGISIIRAGESMEAALRSICPGVKIGKVLIQRDESVADKPALFYYAKLPPNVNDCNILLLDPMLASGGSAICAIEQLLARGLPLSQMTFVSLIGCESGVRNLYRAFPTLPIVVGMIDPQLDDRKFIVPGVGDFGDRYFGTTH